MPIIIVVSVAMKGNRGTRFMTSPRASNVRPLSERREP
jgi:hypothetical protein